MRRAIAFFEQELQIVALNITVAKQNLASFEHRQRRLQEAYSEALAAQTHDLIAGAKPATPRRSEAASRGAEGGELFDSLGPAEASSVARSANRCAMQAAGHRDEALGWGPDEEVAHS